MSESGIGVDGEPEARGKDYFLPKSVPTAIERICVCGCAYRSVAKTPQVLDVRSRWEDLHVPPDSEDRHDDYDVIWATWIAELAILFPGIPCCPRCQGKDLTQHA